MVSQFSLDLYAAVYAAKAGCESAIERRPQLIPTSCFSVTDPTDSTSGLYDMHLRGTAVYGNPIHCNDSRIWSRTSLASRRSSRRRPLRSPRRPSSLLGHRLSRGAVQSNQGPDTRSNEDYGSRLDVLFPGRIHFTSRAPDISYFRKRKHVIIYRLSLRLVNTFIGTNKVVPCSVSDSRMCVPFVHSSDFFRTIAETSCTSGNLFTFQNIGSESHLRCVPVMITRLLLLLKKAGASREDGWSFGEPTTHTTMKFADHRGGVTTGDEIPLDTFVSTQERTQGHE